MTVYVENSNVITLTGLKDEITEEFINNATVELTSIVAANGTAVAGTESITMEYVAESSGVYRAVLEDTIPIIAGRRYHAVVSADGGSGRIGLWRFPFTARRRSSS